MSRGVDSQKPRHFYMKTDRHTRLKILNDSSQTVFNVVYNPFGRLVLEKILIVF